MHGPSRLGKPPSPATPAARGLWGGEKAAAAEPACERVLFVLLSAVFRRRWLLLVAPLLYVGTLVYMGTINLEAAGRIVEVVRRAPPRGSAYRSPEVFRRLWPSMRVYGNTTDAVTSDLELRS